MDTEMQPQPTAQNAYCVILGTPGSTPLTIVGPFATIAEAEAHAQEHQQRGASAIADVLVAQANCP